MQSLLYIIIYLLSRISDIGYDTEKTQIYALSIDWFKMLLLWKFLFCFFLPLKGGIGLFQQQIEVACHAQEKMLVFQTVFIKYLLFETVSKQQ